MEDCIFQNTPTHFLDTCPIERQNLCLLSNLGKFVTLLLLRLTQEFGINIYTLLYIKQITNKDLLYSTGNYTQYFGITYKAKESKKNRYICMHN